MNRYFSIGLLLLALWGAANSEEFKVEVVRANTDGGLLKGTLFVNGELLGPTYENDSLKILAGTYEGRLRYVSQNGHVQGPNGVMANQGDFLLEVANVTWSDGSKRYGILFHAGNKPHHSKGCIMLGPVQHDADGNRILPEGHTLRKLRRKFYGSDDPNSSPAVSIKVVVTE